MAVPIPVTIMRELPQIACVSGVFTLPDEMFRNLKRAAANGLIYIRQDEDSMILSPTRIADGRRRQLNRQYRAQIFRTATRLAVIEMGDTVRLMAVQWRPTRPPRDEDDASSPPGDGSTQS
jgi:hypothetical protein